MNKCRMIILVGLFFVLACAVVIAGNTPGESDDTAVKRAVFQVENLTCAACFTKINQSLVPMEGFAGMGSNLFRKMVAVDFKAPLTPETIGKAITGLGYPATLDGVDSLEKKETFARSRRAGFAGGGCCGGSSVRTGSTGSGPACALPQSSPPNTDI